MSFWSRVGVKIQDLECFRQSCRQHDILYEENLDEHFKMGDGKVVATLKDQKGGSTAYLIQKGGAIQLYMDTDPRYSSITKRLGRNGGKLTRDYTAGVLRKNIKKSGGIINKFEEQADGSLLVKVQAA